MYKKPIFQKTGLSVNESTEGESLENKLERIIENKEKLDGTAPIIFTERKEGVKASTNIRTDRWEIAIDATDKIAKSYQARRDNLGKVVDLNPEKNEGKDEGKA